MTRGINNKKANHGDHIDRISDLPSNVIDVILQHLPIRDVVRTSILSWKWRYMWVSVPQLKFGLDFFEYCYHRDIEDSEVPDIITEVLFLHHGPISKFNLTIPYDCHCEMTCLWKWILFLSKRGIKHLELLSHEHCYVMPSHLFYCQGLTYLKLETFKMSLPPNFCGFKSLLDLHLIDITFESDALERLVSGCPLLNTLTISYGSGFDCINVSSPSLRILCIDRPNRYIKSICLENVKNLIDLTLNLESIGVSDFIQGLPKIQRLCLRERYIEVLSRGVIPQTLQKSINSIKSLELDGVNFDQPRHLLFIVSLLKSSSNLVELVINGALRGSGRDVPPLQDNLRALDCNSCCFSQLQNVNITITTVYEKEHAEHALKLIRFLLANCSSLEVLTFQIGIFRKELDKPFLTTFFSISQDLLKMQRLSQKAEVKFLHYNKS